MAALNCSIVRVWKSRGLEALMKLFLFPVLMITTETRHEPTEIKTIKQLQDWGYSLFCVVPIPIRDWFRGREETQDENKSKDNSANQGICNHGSQVK